MVTIIRQRALVMGFFLSGTLSSLCAGGEYAIRADEAVFMPGKTTVLLATVQKRHTLAMSDDIRGAQVSFYLDGQPLGSTHTNKYGQAFLRIPTPRSQAAQFEARTVVKGRQLTSEGAIFHWDASRTIIAVDIDETVSKTHYSDLFIASIDRYSSPIRNAAAVLTRLQKDYQIYYYSARPRFLHEKTHAWLNKHGFPAGPYADALKFEACFHQERYKSAILTDLRSRFPNILIGIGDKDADDGAHRENRMLSLILGNEPLFGGYSTASIVCRDWLAIEKFFSAHREHLAKPTALAAIIDQSKMDLRPLFDGTRPILISDARARTEPQPVAAQARTSPQPAEQARLAAMQ